MLNANSHYGFRTNTCSMTVCKDQILDFQEGYAVRESLVEGGLDVLKPMEGIEVPVVEMVVMMSGRVSPRWSPAGWAGVCWIVKKRRSGRDRYGPAFPRLLGSLPPPLHSTPPIQCCSDLRGGCSRSPNIRAGDVSQWDSGNVQVSIFVTEEKERGVKFWNIFVGFVIWVQDGLRSLPHPSNRSVPSLKWWFQVQIVVQFWQKN